VKNPFSKLIEYEFFQRSGDFEKTSQIIWWWEKRRFWFNLVVGFIGLFNCLLMVGIGLYTEYAAGTPIGIPDPTMSAIVTILVYGIMANICYTGGWVAELIARDIWQARARRFGQITFALGLFFSVLLTLLPAAVCLVAAVIKLI